MSCPSNWEMSLRNWRMRMNRDGVKEGKMDELVSILQITLNPFLSLFLSSSLLYSSQHISFDDIDQTYTYSTQYTCLINNRKTTRNAKSCFVDTWNENGDKFFIIIIITFIISFMMSLVFAFKCTERKRGRGFSFSRKRKSSLKKKRKSVHHQSSSLICCLWKKKQVIIFPSSVIMSSLRLFLWYWERRMSNIKRRKRIQGTKQ